MYCIRINETGTTIRHFVDYAILLSRVAFHSSDISESERSRCLATRSIVKRPNTPTENVVGRVMSNLKKPPPIPDHVVFFDGNCGFCSALVRSIIRLDRPGLIHFVTIGSARGRELLAVHGQPEPDLDTFFFLDQGTLYSHSSGAIQLSHYLPWPWSMAHVLRLIPRFLRDAVYNWVARHRRTISSWACCRLLSEDEQVRFLD